jgi:hypothetical protein
MISVTHSLCAHPHGQHRAANVKERPFAHSDCWPLSYVRGSVLGVELRLCGGPLWWSCHRDNEGTRLVKGATAWLAQLICY